MNLLRNAHLLPARGFAAAAAGMAVDSVMELQMDGAPPGAAGS